MFNWIIKLGFQYKPQKNHYVNTHENPGSVKYRLDIIRDYFEYKIRTHRWVSIPKPEADKMVEDGELEAELGYEYEYNGSTYMEYPIDDHIKF